ncbi:MAG: hypothetical protein JWN75_987 [Candidatus Saccharibacteria bacterium]|nr:hypothetical protein [Candidatus Saccharibacteria bacterium]
MTSEIPQSQQEQEASPEFKDIQEFAVWLQDEAFRFGERSIYVDNKYDPSLKNHMKTLRKMGLRPGLNIQKSNEVADILKANGVEMGIQDTVSLYNESALYKGHELASFSERTAWIHLTDEAGGTYEVLFDGRLRGGDYHEGELIDRYEGWSDYANYFDRGGISYLTDQGMELEHKAVVDLHASYYDKKKTKHALELANGLRAALDVKLRILIPDFEIIDLSELPSARDRPDVLR